MLDGVYCVAEDIDGTDLASLVRRSVTELLWALLLTRGRTVDCGVALILTVAFAL